MSYENKNIENFPSEPVPVIGLQEIDVLGREGIDEFLRHEIAPIFKVADQPRHNDVVHALAVTSKRTRHTYTGPQVWSEYDPQVPFSPVDTAEHQDGIHKDPYIQVHTHVGGPDAEVTFREYEFSPEIMEVIRSSVERRELGVQQKGSFLQIHREILPPIAREVPAKRHWTSTLHKGDTIFFRNGFNERAQATDSEPVRILTHEFHSVPDAQGVSTRRLVEISAVTPTVLKQKAPRAGWLKRLREK